MNKVLFLLNNKNMKRIALFVLMSISFCSCVQAQYNKSVAVRIYLTTGDWSFYFVVGNNSDCLTQNDPDNRKDGVQSYATAVPKKAIFDCFLKYIQGNCNMPTKQEIADIQNKALTEIRIDGKNDTLCAIIGLQNSRTYFLKLKQHLLKSGFRQKGNEKLFIIINELIGFQKG